MPRVIDLHQHLWPEQLVEALRRRDRAPFMRGWTVYVDGEPPYRADAADHEVGRSARLRSRGGGRPGLCLALQPARDRGPPARRGAALARCLARGRSRASRGAPRVGLGVLGGAGRRRAPDSARRRLRRRSAAGDPADDARGMVGRGAGARSGRGGRPAGPRAPGSGTRRCICCGPARLVGGGRGLHRAAAGSLVGLARGRRARALPHLARGVRRRRRTRSAPAGAPHRARRRRQRRGRPWAVRRHLVVRAARRSTPWCGCSGSTPSCWAATGRTRPGGIPSSARRRRSGSGARTPSGCSVSPIPPTVVGRRRHDRRALARHRRRARSTRFTAGADHGAQRRPRPRPPARPRPESGRALRARCRPRGPARPLGGPPRFQRRRTGLRLPPPRRTR